jgi:hypothetical protein
MHRLTISAVTFFATAFAAPVAAQAVVDHSDMANHGVGFPFYFDFGPGFQINNMPAGQSFTAGLSGQLTAFQFAAADQGAGASDFTFTVYAGDGTGGAVLRSATQNLSCVGIPSGCAVTFDTSGMGINVVAGQQYSLAVSAISGPALTLAFLGTDSDSYAGGHSFFGAGYGNQPGWDLDFTDYIDPGNSGAVPEPASWALMLGGFGLVGCTLRARRRSVAFG